MPLIVRSASIVGRNAMIYDRHLIEFDEPKTHPKRVQRNNNEKKTNRKSLINFDELKTGANFRKNSTNLLLYPICT